MSSPIAFDEAFLAQFEILSELSTGGMGIVYLARQKSLDRKVAVKFPLLSDRDMIERFELEAKMLASLDHPCIVQIYAWGETSGHPYLVEEFIEGTTLRETLDRRRVLKQVEALAIGRDIADALTLIHSKGLVHRDLKPHNVLVTETNAKLIDFGIARDQKQDRRTRAGVILGTPEYLAPEMLEGEGGGPPADVYAFGTILFEMLSGDLPLPAPDVSTMLRRRAREDAPLVSGKIPTVTPALEALIAQMLSRDPAARPSIADQVLPELEAQLAQYSGFSADAPTPAAGQSAVSGRPAREAPDDLDRTELSSPDRVAARQPRATSLSQVVPASSGRRAAASASRLPSARRPVAAPPPPERHPGWWIAGGAALGLAVAAAFWLPRARELTPPRAEQSRLPTVPAELSAARFRAESLVAEAESAKTPLARATAYYQLQATLAEGGSAVASSAPKERVAKLEALVLDGGAGRDQAASGVLKLLEGGLPPAAKAARELAARDAASFYASETAAELLARLSPISSTKKAYRLSTKAKDQSTRAVAVLKADATSFASSPEGMLWTALEERMPSLLTNPGPPLETRQKLATKIGTARGLGILYRRAGLPSPVDVERALRGVVTNKSMGSPKPFTRQESLASLLSLAGLRGPGADLVVNKRGQEGYLHPDAGIWWVGALGSGSNAPDWKDKELVSAVVLPPAGSGPDAREIAFLGCVEDLDPEDAFSLRLRSRDRNLGELELQLMRPDSEEGYAGHALCWVSVSTRLLPPAIYDLEMRPERMLAQRGLIDGQRRMRSLLLRLSAAAKGS